MYQSIVERRGPVAAFPAFLAERVYMREFTKKSGLPKDLSRWQGVVDAMLDGVDSDDRLYIMIDQKEVAAGDPHRRAGVHIDGYWCAGLAAHSGGGRHSPRPPAPMPRPTRPIRLPGDGGTRQPRGRHSSQVRLDAIDSVDRAAAWASPDFSVPEGIILASDITGAVAWRGQYSGVIGDMGDCSGIDVSGLDRVTMDAGCAYAGNVSFLHESLPIPVNCRRSLVRINVRGWSPLDDLAG